MALWPLGAKSWALTTKWPFALGTLFCEKIQCYSDHPYSWPVPATLRPLLKPALHRRHLPFTSTFSTWSQGVRCALIKGERKREMGGERKKEREILKRSFVSYVSKKIKSSKCNSLSPCLQTLIYTHIVGCCYHWLTTWYNLRDLCTKVSFSPSVTPPSFES